MKAKRRSISFLYLLPFFLFNGVLNTSGAFETKTPKSPESRPMEKSESVSSVTQKDNLLSGVLFEGYYKILSGGVHVGFLVSKYTYDPKTQKYFGGYFLKTNMLGSDVTESLRAESNSSLQPLSYEYTSLVNGEGKSIDAKFNGAKMTAVIKTIPKPIESAPGVPSKNQPKESIKTVSLDLPKGTFLSSFLVYLLLRSKTGMQTNTKYNYTAIAEEDASLAKGEALVGKKESYNGFDAFKITNKFKGARFISYVSDRGEVLATNSPATSIGTDLVAKADEATVNIPFSSPILKSLFGEVPKGFDNLIAKTKLIEDEKAKKVLQDIENNNSSHEKNKNQNLATPDLSTTPTEEKK